MHGRRTCPVVLQSSIVSLGEDPHFSPVRSLATQRCRSTARGHSACASTTPSDADTEHDKSNSLRHELRESAEAADRDAWRTMRSGWGEELHRPARFGILLDIPRTFGWAEWMNS